MTPENTPATKADLLQLEERMTRRLEEQISAAVERLEERSRDLQTELLKAFLPFQEQTRARYAALEGRDTALEARMDTMERRVAEIERKFLLNPPAA